jgi:uncharacterized protein YidB (DUF937 family)
MNGRVKWMIVGVLAVMILVGVVSSVGAQDTDGNRRPRQHIRDVLVNAVAEATGLSTEDIVAQFRDGKTLAEIVTEHGGDPKAVIDGAAAQLTDDVNQAVADGRITQTQADRILSNLDRILDNTMNFERGGLRDRLENRLDNTLVGTIADLAGVTPRDILQEWRQGGTLTDVITAHGLDSNTVLAEITTRITDQVNQAVENGRITQEQADTILAGLPDRLNRRLTIEFPQRPGQRGLRGTI